MLTSLAKAACYALGGYSTFKALNSKATLGKKQRWACFWIVLIALEVRAFVREWARC